MYSGKNGKFGLKQKLMVVVGVAVAIAAIIASWKLGWLSKAKSALTGLAKTKTPPTETEPQEAATASGEGTIAVA